MLYLSIIIPSYNSGNTILPLLSSIYASNKVNLGEIEVIIVDDFSKDETVNIIQKNAAKYKRLNNLRIIVLKNNSGPAEARNIGARHAKGQVVLFFDADVKPHLNSLYELVNSFKTDPDLYAMTGVWDKKQKTKKFFPKFKALRDWSYWINERDPKNYYYLFSTRVAAINRKLFLRLGGFDTTYKAALVEDMELTYRIAKRYAVVFNSKVIVHHEFEDFTPIAKKYFWRSYYWSRLYRERKKFDPVATTSKEAITTISAGSIFVVMVLIVLCNLSHLSYMTNILIYIFLLFLFLHIWGVRKFLWFCMKEEGIIFSIKAFVTGLILYLVILSGAVFSFYHMNNSRHFK
jgi:glycosyltransferase involved in cell wall biosynthesis